MLPLVPSGFAFVTVSVGVMLKRLVVLVCWFEIQVGLEGYGTSPTD